MLIVMFAIGSTDLLFALDSIPAIFGLTQEPFLVFTANAFALMGLRQLYFLLGSLLTKLVYLSYGLAVILGFIGVKLVLEALHENNLPFLNGGEPVPVPTVGIALSLSVIVGVLAITTVASLVKSRRDAAAERPCRPPSRPRRSSSTTCSEAPRRRLPAVHRRSGVLPGPVARTPHAPDRSAPGGGRWCRVTAANRPSTDLRRHPGVGRLAAAVGGRAGVEQAQRRAVGAGRGGVPGDVAVPEDEHVDVRERGGAPAFPPGGGPGLVDHREPDAGQLHPGDLGQPGPQRRPVVVAVDAHQPRRPRLERVEQVDVHPVAGVHDHVGRVDRRPQRFRQVARPARQVGVGGQDEPRSGQLAPSRSTTNTSVSPGLITPPAPRSP